MDTMTAENRALHYMRWHVAAYGAPAPMDEIAAGLYDSHGMTETQSHACWSGCAKTESAPTPRASLLLPAGMRCRIT